MNKNTNVQNVEINKGADNPTKINWQRVTQGFFTGLAILAMLVFWLTFAYAVWAQNFELLEIFVYIIAIGAGVFGTIHFLSKLVKDISKK